MCVRTRVCMFIYLCTCGWKMDTEGVTLFKESPQRLIVKQKEVKDEAIERFLEF